MKRRHALECCIAGMVLAAPGLAFGQIYAMMNYETKSPDSLKVLKTPVPTGPRKDGIAVIDVDPQSKGFGKIVQDMPIPPDFMSHHLFYNRDQTKIYVTSLGKGEIRVIDMKKTPYAMKVVAVPDCQVGEDVVFSDDNKTWYLSCMGNQTVVIGNAVTDQPTKSVKVGVPYPHGVAVSPSIDRMLTTGTVRASDGGDAGEMISEVQVSTGKVVNSYKVSNKPSPSGEAPVEILFVPGVNPPMAYVTNLYGGTLWLMRWNTDKKAFDVSQAHDFAGENSGVPLEMYFSKDLDRMYVTTGKPGSMHIFDTSDITSPKLIKSIPAAEGSHHVAFTKDGRYAYVQNALLNLPGLSDGSITVVDLKEGKPVKSMDTLKMMGLNANCVVLLPKWNDPKGH